MAFTRTINGLGKVVLNGLQALQQIWWGDMEYSEIPRKHRINNCLLYNSWILEQNFWISYSQNYVFIKCESVVYNLIRAAKFFFFHFVGKFNLVFNLLSIYDALEIKTTIMKAYIVCSVLGPCLNISLYWIIFSLNNTMT